jgi:hypothetical protein
MNVGEMQRKLSLWATQDRERKFYGLYDLLYDRDWLLLAHDYVKQNAGSVTAGCDGINMQIWDENLEENQEQLAQELQSETFKPMPVRRVHIPKPNGKTRPLGIPSIKDRIVQEALRMVLEPIFEADFSPYSFGFAQPVAPWTRSSVLLGAPWSVRNISGSSKEISPRTLIRFTTPSCYGLWGDGSRTRRSSAWSGTSYVPV